jgi:hypothetical protein
MSITFINQSVDGDSYFWTFGDGGVSYEPNPTHSYQTAGTYLVSLTVWNDCGQHTITKYVTARCMKLVMSADPDEVPFGFCTYISADALGVSGNVVQYTYSPSGIMPEGQFGPPEVLACPTESMWIYVEALNLETGCIAYDSIWVKVWGGDPGGLTGDGDHGRGNGKRISIIPNPATDFISATLPEGDYGIYLFDLSGKEVRRTSTDGYFELDIRDLPGGQYLLHVTEGDRVIDTQSFTIL